MNSGSGNRPLEKGEEGGKGKGEGREGRGREGRKEWGGKGEYASLALEEMDATAGNL